ncbi:NAD(P)H-dependent flavin oxidoreductase [Faunimonas sp. B44]|uniref:NAD(P)H-dependent flavin oxidoreductase n=1 Tax=Faunimonas sp. B44 TaxID=3461493 RepID=UPI004044BADE
MPRDNWPTSALLDLLEIELPLVQAPMAGAQGWDMAAAVSAAGGLGSIPCAMLTVEGARGEVERIRAATNRGFAMNFFCHPALHPAEGAAERWRARLAPYYTELDLEPPAELSAGRAPFDDAFCALVEEIRPKVVSFHFGLPPDDLLARARSTGAKVLSSATTVAEARWLVEKGVDAIIAQGAEAGGHRGMFLADDISAQVGTMALVPQIVDAVDVPVIAAGGIADGRGIAAAFALGASAVQIGTAYLHTPEARISPMHREALRTSAEDESVLTNVFTGRPARGLRNRIVRDLGPMSEDAPVFPFAASFTAPLRAAAEKLGVADFSPLWTGQAGALGRPLPAAELTAALMADARERMQRLAGQAADAPPS